MSDYQPFSLKWLAKKAESRPPGYYDAVLSHAKLRPDGLYEITRADNRAIKEQFGLGPVPGLVPVVRGVGDHFFIVIRERIPKARKIKRCGCGEWIAKMNNWGPEGCEEHTDEIVEHMLSNTHKLGRIVALALKCIPGIARNARAGVLDMLAEAINRARSTESPAA